jgi:hypothetical protein
MNNLTVLSDKDAEVINGGFLNNYITNFPNVSSLNAAAGSHQAFSTNTGIGLIGIGALSLSFS